MKKMKKILIHLAACLSLLAMGCAATSCDSDTVQQLLNLLMGGKTYVFEGTYTMELYGSQTDSEKLAPISPELTFPGTKVQVTASQSPLGGGTTAKMVLPGTTLTTNATMSDVSLSNLTLTEETLSVNDNSTGDGTLTVDGKEYSLNAVDITATVNADALTMTEVVCYFGSSAYAVRLTMVDGKVVTTE